MSTSSLTKTEADPSLGRRPLGPTWLRVLLIPVFCLLPTYLAMGLVLILPGMADRLGSQDMTQMLPVAIGMHVVIFALAVLSCWIYLRFLQRSPLRASGLVWTGKSAAFLLLGLAVSVVVNWVALGSTHLAGLLRPTDLTFTVANLIGLLTAAFLMQGIPEELFFRGVLQHVLASRPITGVLASTVLFGVIHFTSSGGQQNNLERFIYVGVAAAFGFAAAALLLYTRSLWVAVGVHAGHHLGNRTASWAGIGDGPWAWALEIVLFTAVGLVALYLWKRAGAGPVVIDR